MMQSRDVFDEFLTRASLTGRGIPKEVVAKAVDENQNVFGQPDGRTTA